MGLGVGQARHPISLLTLSDIGLTTQTVDLIFFCDVLHHIENRTAYYPKLVKALRPGGRVVAIDFY